MAAVVDAAEVGFGEVVEFAIEALDVEARGDGPRGEAGAEQEGGGE